MDVGSISKSASLRVEDVEVSLDVAPISSPAAPEKRNYPPAAPQPTQHAPLGIRFDFNSGARVQVPPRAEAQWRVCLRDLDTGNVLFDTRNKGAFVSSNKRYYVRFAVEVWELDDVGAQTEVLRHEFDARGRDVLIQLPVGTLRDSLAWFPYVARFAELHGAHYLRNVWPYHSAAGGFLPEYPACYA